MFPSDPTTPPPIQTDPAQHAPRRSAASMEPEVRRWAPFIGLSGCIVTGVLGLLIGLFGSNDVALLASAISFAAVVFATRKV